MQSFIRRVAALPHVLAAIAFIVATAVGLGLAHGATPASDPAPQTGVASWYGYQHQGRPTASGETLRGDQLTAAHRRLPFGTRVRVTDLDSGRSVVVRINDRGPFVAGRIIDLSEGAARRLGMRDRGLARVAVARLADAR